MAKRMKIKSFTISPGSLLTFIIVLMSLSLFILRVNLSLSYLPEIGGVSINVLYGIIRLVSGSDLYTNPEFAPFPIIQYMPLHFHIVAFLSKVIGINNDVHAMMSLNRLFCLLIDLITVYLLGKTLIHSFNLSKNIAWPLALIYFLSIPSIIYGRVDNLYLLFFMTTLVFFIKFTLNESTTEKDKKKYLFIAGILCGLCILTKQTGIFLAVFCSIYLLLYLKSFRQFFFFAGGLIITLGISLLLLFPESLHLVKLNVIDGVKNGINANWFFEVLLKNFFMKYSYILATGIFVSALLWKNNKNTGYVFVGAGIAWYFLTATATAFKAGSGSNYYLEYIIFSILGVALLIKSKVFTHPHITLFALILSPFFLVAAANDKGWGDIGLMKKAKKNYSNCIEVANYLKPKLQKGEWVLTDFHKENTLNLQLSDRALFPCREVALYFTRPIGVFHFKEFESLIKNKKIPYLVTKKGELLEVFIDVPLTQYEPDTTIGNFQIFKRLN
jgi:hypothetical protein